MKRRIIGVLLGGFLLFVTTWRSFAQQPSGKMRDESSRVEWVELLTRSGSNYWIRVAVLSSLGDESAPFFVALLRDAKFVKTPHADGFLGQFANRISQRNQAEETTVILKALAEPPLADQPAVQLLAFVNLADAAKRSGKSLDTILRGNNDLTKAKQRFGELVTSSHEVALDRKRSEAERVLAVRMLAHGDLETATPTLTKLYSINEPLDVQLAAVQSLAAFAHPSVAKLFVKYWPNFSPRTRGEVIEVLLRDERSVDALLSGLESKTIQVVELPLACQVLLRKLKDVSLQKRADKLFAGVTNANRRDVFAKYQTALEMKGDTERGRQIFTKSCIACHRIGTVGKHAGPDLTLLPKQKPEQLLLAILDPNRDVDRPYLNYVIFTKSGRASTGMIVAETANTITLRRAEGADDVILRTDIDELASSGQSLMPEGFEQYIDPQQMADLLRFLDLLAEGQKR